MNSTTSTNTTTTATQATVVTSRGSFTITLYPDFAPQTVANFVQKATSGYYNGLKFHRVEDWVVQGGDPLSRDASKQALWGTGGGTIATELSKQPFGVGAVGVARGGDINVSNDSQFFITKKDSQFLNNQYTNFGQVLSGMDVVNSLQIGDTITEITVK